MDLPIHSDQVYSCEGVNFPKSPSLYKTLKTAPNSDDKL